MGEKPSTEDIPFQVVTRGWPQTGEVPKALARDANIGALGLRLLIHLAPRPGKSGDLGPEPPEWHLEELATALGVTEAQAKDALAAVRELGWIGQDDRGYYMAWKEEQVSR